MKQTKEINGQPVKTPRRFRLRALMITGVSTLVGTLALVFLAAWLIIGPEGLTLVEGLALINTRFVGPYEESEVVDQAMSGMIAALGDRWSYYLDPESYQATQERRRNEYVGVGITITYEREEGLLILEVQPDSPAAAAGLAEGEVITAVAGQSLAGEARYEGASLISGEAGSTLSLTVLGTDGAERTVDVTLATIEEDPVSYTLLDSGVGYIQVENFYLRSAEQVEAAVADLQAQGATALVFDMRNNGGGYLDELTEMLDYLLPEGPIFRTRDRAGNEQVTESDADCVDLPMVTLVNQDTYSAAEIFAAELQEKVGAGIVGVETSGKGYSQQTYPLFNGGAIGISTNTYYTGEGTSLIGTGVTLDREVALSEEDAALLLAGQLPYDQDEQLQAALELLQQG